MICSQSLSMTFPYCRISWSALIWYVTLEFLLFFFRMFLRFNLAVVFQWFVPFYCWVISHYVTISHVFIHLLMGILIVRLQILIITAKTAMNIWEQMSLGLHLKLHICLASSPSLSWFFCSITGIFRDTLLINHLHQNPWHRIYFWKNPT